MWLKFRVVLESVAYGMEFAIHLIPMRVTFVSWFCFFWILVLGPVV